MTLGPVAVHNFLAFRDQAAMGPCVFYLMPQTTEVSKIMYPRHPRVTQGVAGRPKCSALCDVGASLEVIGAFVVH